MQPEVPTRYQRVVLNMQGRTVLDQQAGSLEGVTTVDLRVLPTGLYQVQLFDGKKLTTQPLVKE